MAIVLGTRPEIIKLAPVVTSLEEQNMPYRLLHTGQHYDFSMSKTFLEAFGLEIDELFEFGGLPRGNQVGQITDRLTKLFLENTPSCVVVQGDTNTALAGALAGNCCDIPIVHIEAGLRSYDKNMPEEHNRVMIDHISDVLCAPTSHSEKLLHNESISGKIIVTGNTELDAIKRLTPSWKECEKIATRFGVEPQNFVIATIHRPENTDDRKNLYHIVQALNASTMPVLLAAHPRTLKALEDTELLKDVNPRLVTITEPLPIIQMWALLKICGMAISDSGGIQEDVTAFGTPLLVIRNSTERPEAIGTFTKLVPPSKDLPKIVQELTGTADLWRDSLRRTPSPFLSPSGLRPGFLSAAAVLEASGATKKPEVLQGI